MAPISWNIINYNMGKVMKANSTWYGRLKWGYESCKTSPGMILRWFYDSNSILQIQVYRWDYSLKYNLFLSCFWNVFWRCWASSRRRVSGWIWQVQGKRRTAIEMCQNSLVAKNSTQPTSLTHSAMHVDWLHIFTMFKCDILFMCSIYNSTSDQQLLIQVQYFHLCNLLTFT